VRTLGLDVCLGNDLGREVEPFPEVVETFRGQGVIIPLPGELGLDIAARVEGLEGLDYVEVLGLDLLMLGKVIVLLCDDNALAEEVLVDLLAIRLWDKHFGGICRVGCGGKVD